MDIFYNYIEVGKVYEMSNFRVNFAKRPYNTLNNEYELQANRTCIIHSFIFHEIASISLVGDDTAIQSQHYNFVPISEVGNMEPKKTVDILAIVIVLLISSIFY